MIRDSRLAPVLKLGPHPYPSSTKPQTILTNRYKAKVNNTTIMPVLLITSDKELFRVEKEVAQLSTLIRNLLEGREDSEYPIPLPNVTSPVLKK
ncbi:hypothetical protein FRB91_001290, partial [Serendipita sp. 411]